MADKTESKDYKMLGYKKIHGIITVETGLHIGGSADAIMIAGMDNPIIRNPVNKEPYIPGSSLKGKMRSLLEWRLGRIDEKKGDPHKCDEPNCPICRIFGTSADDAQLGPTRLIVRDAHVAQEYKDRMKERNPNWTCQDLVEEKSENTINRISARANPRPLQRVVTGAQFEFEMIYRIFDLGDKGTTDQDLFKHVLEGLKLIEADALGGSGSRGCGKVSFDIQLNGGDKLTPVKDVKPNQIPEHKFED